MPANRGPQAAHLPEPPIPKGTTKYTSKDGSKVIKLPKNTMPTDTSEPPTPTVASNPPQADPANPSNDPAPGPGVNRKKQKRREKAAAKALAGQTAAHVNGSGLNLSVHERISHGSPRSDVVEPPISEPEEDVFTPDPMRHSGANGTLVEDAGKSKKSRKKKKKTAGTGEGGADQDTQSVIGAASSSQLPAAPRGPGISKERIWNTSSQEERERIKQFWLGLGEDERKSLVKVEKNAVLKKMKEQQKHTCSCTVCGRKRTAIEEELETLYDAYYQELEQFANQGEVPALLGASSNLGSSRYGRALSNYAGQQPSRGHIVEQLADDDDGVEEDGGYDEAYSEDEYDDEFSEDEPAEDDHRHLDQNRADFLAFGNSLQVKGMSLTVFPYRSSHGSSFNNKVCRGDPYRCRRHTAERWQKIHRNDGKPGGTATQT
jgi:hypothetical protein